MLLDGAPADLELDPLPEAVQVDEGVTHPPYDVAVLFCPDHATLVRRWPDVHAAVTAAGRLWVAWPKRASGMATDLGENQVRAFGLAHGRVDVKVCAIDATWSALAFVVRLHER